MSAGQQTIDLSYLMERSQRAQNLWRCLRPNDVAGEPRANDQDFFFRSVLTIAERGAVVDDPGARRAL
ncbi:MAG: hypothetical protein WDO24_23505 [Pseudomonadota bacterium]